MKIPLYKILWDESDVAAVSEAIRKGTDWATGPKISEFEDRISKHLGRKHCVAFNSGTSALHASLLSLGIGPGDEVIVPSFTFIATANSALFVGAKPVFADIEEESYGLDLESVEGLINDRTKAIIPIHYGGRAASKIADLQSLALRHNIPLVEDAAESFGAVSKGRDVGTFGDLAILSFCGNKLVTCGEGGMALTDSTEIFERLRLARSHGRPESENYFSSGKIFDYISLGFNWRMSNITAALGISQFNKLEQLIAMRRAQADRMSARLKTSHLVSPLQDPAEGRNIYQMYTIKLASQSIRDGLRSHLTRSHISNKIYFDPVHHTSYYRSLGYGNVKLPVTERVSKRVLTLPIYPHMTDEEREYVVDCSLNYLLSESTADQKIPVPA